MPELNIKSCSTLRVFIRSVNSLQIRNVRMQSGTSNGMEMVLTAVDIRDCFPPYLIRWSAPVSVFWETAKCCFHIKQCLEMHGLVVQNGMWTPESISESLKAMDVFNA